MITQTNMHDRFHGAWNRRYFGFQFGWLQSALQCDSPVRSVFEVSLQSCDGGSCYQVDGIVDVACSNCTCLSTGILVSQWSSKSIQEAKLNRIPPWHPPSHRDLHVIVYEKHPNLVDRTLPLACQEKI